MFELASIWITPGISRITITREGMKQEVIGTKEIGEERWIFVTYQLCDFGKLASLNLRFLVCKVRD